MILFEGGCDVVVCVVIVLAGRDNDLWNGPWWCVRVHVRRVQNGCGHAVVRVETL